MKFNEKLQHLRKDNKLSQEQLADMLNVSRQSVSKWESGQSYPEMDKLIIMTKIFKCNLDYLVNEDIKELDTKEKIQKSSINIFTDEILDIINRSVNMFKNMKGRDIIKVIIELLIISFILSLFRAPFNYICTLGHDVFYNFGDRVGGILSSIWDFLIKISYMILFVITFVYIYKNAYLDKYDNSKKEFDIPGKENKNEKKIVNEEISTREINNKRTYSFLDFLVKIFVLTIKIFIIFFSIPFIFSLIFFSASLLISFILIFKGVFYIGIFFGIIALMLLNIFYINIVFNFIFNKKSNVKNNFILFLTGIILLGASGGLMTYGIADTKYINEVPSAEKISVLNKNYDFSKDLVIDSSWRNNSYNSIEFIKDDSLNNKIKIVVNYYKEFTEINIKESENNKISINTTTGKKQNPSNIMYLVIKDLSKKEIHNYSKLFIIDVKVYGTSSNIDILKSNRDIYYQKINETNFQNQINEYEQRIQSKDQELNTLREESASLKSENEQYKNKIQEYKDRLSELLGL